MVLTLAGATLQLQTGMDCNIFGGPASCKYLPTNASYLQQCPGADARVDCAFYSQVLDNVYDSPVDDLTSYLSRQAWAPPADSCPQCFDKLQRLWCSLASPRCGTFRAYTRLALLPGLNGVVRAYGKGDSELEALSEAVAGSIDALGAALPCREMCTDLVSTCGCGGGGEDTFGRLLEWMTAQAGETGKAVPPAFQRVLFKRVWDRPFCDFFAPRAAANFSGACTPEPAAACAAGDRWCGAGGGGPGGAGGPNSVLRYVQGIVVLQLARAATGWITDDAVGLWRTKAALAGGDSRAALDELSAKYVDGRVHASGSGPVAGPALGGAQVAAIAVLCTLGGVALAAAGVAGYRYYAARRSERSYFELQSGGAFSALAGGGAGGRDDGL